MTPRNAELPDLDGRVFCSVTNSSTGHVDSETRFHYRQEADEIWAEYSGGSVKRGFLVGTREGDHLDFRYTHLNAEWQTSSGHCVSTITRNDQGSLVLNETWEWESCAGQGTSILVEVL